MDTAVAPVQAYLNGNGYFTVAEHPVLETLRGDQVRTVTDSFGVPAPLRSAPGQSPGPRQRGSVRERTRPRT